MFFNIILILFLSTFTGIYFINLSKYDKARMVFQNSYNIYIETIKKICKIILSIIRSSITLKIL